MISNAASLGSDAGMISLRRSQGRQSFAKERPSRDLNLGLDLDRRRDQSLSLQHQEREIADRLRLLPQNAHAAAYAPLLHDCPSLETGKAIHEHVAKNCAAAADPYVGNLLVGMYGRFRRPGDARRVFDSLPQRNAFSWNLMLTAYARAGDLEYARSVYDALPRPNVVAANIMVALYGKYGRVLEAREVFLAMPERDAASWNSLISALARAGRNREALDLYRRSCLEGARHDFITFASALEVCARIGALGEGRWIHAAAVEIGYGGNLRVATAAVSFFGQCDRVLEARFVFENLPERDAVVWTAMLVVYAQAGHLLQAEDFFARMPDKDEVAWTAMMAAYARNGHPVIAIRMFRLMDLEGVYPTGVTFITALDACAGIPSLALGRIVYSCTESVEPRLESAIKGCLLHLYARCGALGDAKAVFDSIRDRNVVTWSSIIAANAQNGLGHRALDLFYVMLLDGVAPAEITLISVLHACCHSGLSARAPEFFHAMISDFAIRPIADHFVCMIDVLGRSGQIESAAELVASMPFEPNDVAWTILLNACKVHRDVERAKRITDRIVKLDGSWQYVLLSNINAEGDEVEIERDRQGQRDDDSSGT